MVVLFMFLVHLVVLLGLCFKFYYRLLQSTTAVVTWLENQLIRNKLQIAKNIYSVTNYTVFASSHPTVVTRQA